MDYDHYYFKLEQLRGKSNSDPNKVIRVRLLNRHFPLEPEQVPGVPDHADRHHRPSDRQVHRVRDRASHLPRLRVPDAPLRPEGLLQRPRQEHVQVQVHLAERGHAHGAARGALLLVRLLFSPFFTVDADLTSSTASAGPRKGPRARRAEESDEEVEERRPASGARQASSGSFRRPTPGASSENAFSRNGAKKNPFANRASNAPAPVDIDEPAPAPRRQKGVYAVVLYDFPGEDEDELPLREGQKVRVTRQHESGWWTGELNGEIGMFPANYVKLL